MGRGTRGSATRGAIGIAATLSLMACAVAAWAGTTPEDERPPLDPAAKMPELPPAEIDNTLAIGGEEIDARKLSTRMTAEVRINDTGPYRFVVDSGADTTVVGQRIAAELALPASEPTILNGMTGSQVVPRAMVDELQLGPTAVGGLEVAVLHERDLGAEGMLGLDALVEQRLMFDFEKRVISVDDGRTPLPRMDGGVIVVNARLRRGQLILTEVKADRHKIQAVVDTGSEITIGNTALRDLLLSRNPKQFTKIAVTGVTGETVDMQFARIDQLKLGPVTLQNVPIAFYDVPPFEVFGIDKKPSLLLGTDLMENFRKVSLDFHARKVRFQLKKCGPTKIRLATSTRFASRLSTDLPEACAR